MNKDMRGAFIAWRLAIEAKMEGIRGENVRSLAEQFGQQITTPECLQIVMEFFNWERIAGLIDLH